MGRPLNDKFFGDPEAPGKQIQIQVWLVDGEGDGKGLTNGFIVSQTANSFFIVDNSFFVGEIKLQSSTPNAVGEGRIQVSPFGGGTEWARVVQAHNVKTFEGNIYNWSTEAADAVGEADLPLA